MEDRFLRPGAAAAYLGISSRYLGKLRRAGKGPRAYCRPGSQPRYLLSELEDWARGRRPATAPLAVAEEVVEVTG